MPKIEDSITKLNPVLPLPIIIIPITKARSPVIKAEAGKLNQKERCKLLTKTAETYAPTPQKAAIPRFIIPVLNNKTKVKASAAFTMIIINRSR
jgi:hypothetical protein